MFLISFDIGEKNFAYTIAEIFNAEIRLISYQVHNLKKKNKQPISQTCLEMNNILEKVNLQQCKFFIIEKQLSKNIKCQRLEQHLWSYLTCHFDHENVILFHPQQKINFFIGKNKLTSRERKKWSVEKAYELFPNLNLEIKKKDDICDSILQLYVFFNLNLK
jgi:hypothetical protein